MKILNNGAALGVCVACAVGLLAAVPAGAQEQDPAAMPGQTAAQTQDTMPEAMPETMHSPAPLIIRDFVLTHGVEAREPADRTESFRTTDGQAYAFLRIANDGPPTDVTVQWRYEGAVHGTVDLGIGSSPGWRTWSSANLKPGDWTVEVRDAEGVVLAERRFTVENTFAGDPVQTPESASQADFQQITQEPQKPAMGRMPMPPDAAPRDGDG